MFKKYTLKVKAFTLAEVLITLGIIGVVAAMMIPSLVQGAQEKAQISALKKAYSIYSQAFTMAVNDNGAPDTWNIGDIGGTPQPYSNAQNILTILTPYLKITKICNGVVTNGCTPSASYQLSGSLYNFDATRIYRAEIADGSYLYVYSLKSDCSWNPGATYDLSHVCAYMIMDVNGAKLPNTQGKDIFWFYLSQKVILPIGTQQESSIKFNSNCSDKTTADGMGCTAWVLFKENLDYLHCSGLNWNNPSCP